MSVKIETLELEIKSQATEAAKGLDHLANSLKALKKSTLNANSISGLTRNLTGLNNALKVIDNSEVTKINKLSHAMQRLAKATSQFKGAGSIGGNLRSIRNGLSEAQGGLNRSTESITPTTATPNIRNLVSLAPALQKMTKPLAIIGPMAGRAGKALGTYFGGKIKDVVNRTTKSFHNLFKSISRIAMYRALRGAIKFITQGFMEGINAVSRYSRAIGGDFARTMDNLSSQVALMNASLGAMAVPLIQMLAPAINVVTNAVIQLANALNQVFSMLAGKSGWTKATSAVKKYDDSVSGAANSQKKLTAGIDELNVLDDSSGGGGGAGNADYGFSGQEEFAQWVKDLKSLFGSGDFEGAGSYLANMLNNMVANWDAKAWGEQLGQKIQSAIEFAYGFLTTFNTEGIGSKIAESLNSMLAQIDFATLGATVSEFINRFVDLIKGFVLTFDWMAFGQDIVQYIFGRISAIDLGSVGETLGYIVLATVDLIKGFVTGVDWGEFALTVITKIKDLFVGFIDTVFGVDVESSVLSLTERIGQFFVDAWTWVTDTWDTAARWFNDNVIIPIRDFFAPIVETIGQFFRGAWTIVRAVWIVVSTWFKTTVIDPVVNYFAPIVQTISGFFSTMWTLVKGVWGIVFSWFKMTVIDPIVNDFNTGLKKIGDFFTSLWDGIKNGVVSAMNFVIDKIEGALNGIIDMINDVLSGFNDVAEWAGDVVGEDWDGVGQIGRVSFARLANGGSVMPGDFFYANENGAELIAPHNGRTNVMSNDDIVESITLGVYDAVVQAMGQSGEQTQTIQVYLDGKQIEASTRTARQRRGVSIANGGVYNYS